MPAILQQLLEDVLDNLEDTGDLITSSEGQLDEEQCSTVAEHLTVTLDRIDEAIGRMAASGRPEPCDDCSDVELVAGQCTALARGLFDSKGQPLSHEEAIANKLRTIEHLIQREPDGLRCLVSSDRTAGHQSPH